MALLLRFFPAQRYLTTEITQDQPYYLLSYKVNTTTMTQQSQPGVYAKSAEEYQRSGTGPLTTINAGEAMGMCLLSID